MVKILMVHGFGTNANIFEAQTALIRASLPSHWEYHFIAGTLECGPAPGIPEFYPNQNYRCWFSLPNLKAIEAAHDILEEIIEDEGPFDVAWGFSQGASIISSFLLQHTLENPHDPPPFRSAIFMNGLMPYCATQQLGIDVTPILLTHQEVPCTLAETKSALDCTHIRYPSQEAVLAEARNEKLKEGTLVSDIMKKEAQSLVATEAAEGRKKTEWDEFESRMMFVEVNTEIRIEIPTAHFVSDEDEMRTMGETLARMCEEKTRIIYTSSGGHNVPKLDRDTRKVIQIVERTVDKAGFAW